MEDGSDKPDFGFIMDDNKKPTSKLFGAGSKKQKIIFIFLGVSVLLIIIVLLLSLLTSSGSSDKESLISLAQKQTEIIRVSGLGITKSRSTNSLNLAVNTNISVTSSQNELLASMTKSGIKADKKTLALGKNSKTDLDLNAAEQSAKYDEVFDQIMRTELKSYQQKLTSAHNLSTSKSQKTILANAYAQTKILLGEDIAKTN